MKFSYVFDVMRYIVYKWEILPGGRFGERILVAACTSRDATRAAFCLLAGIPPSVFQFHTASGEVTA